MTRLLLTVATILALAPMTAHAQRRTATPPPESIACWATGNVCALGLSDYAVMRVADVMTVTGTIRNHTPAIIHGVTARAYSHGDDGVWVPVIPSDLLPGATGTFSTTVAVDMSDGWGVGVAMAGMAGAIVTPPTATVTPVPPTAETPTVTPTVTPTETVTPTPTRSPLVVARGWMPYALR